MKLRIVRMIAVLLVAGSISAKAEALVQVYTDPILTAEIALQTSTLKELQEQQYEALSATQKAHIATSIAMTTLHDLEKKSYNYLYNAASGMQNLYQLVQIGEQVVDIVEIANDCLKEAKKNPKSAVFAAIVSKKYFSAGTEIAALVSTIKEIALDGIEFTRAGWDEQATAFISGKYEPQGETKKHNLLNPVERLAVIHEVQNRLKNIYWDFVQLRYNIKYMNFWTFFRKVDFDSWYYITDGKRLAQDIVNSWSKLDDGWN